MVRVALGRPFPTQETDRSMRRCLSHGLAAVLVLLTTVLATPGVRAAQPILADKLAAEAPPPTQKCSRSRPAQQNAHESRVCSTAFVTLPSSITRCRPRSRASGSSTSSAAG